MYRLRKKKNNFNRTNLMASERKQRMQITYNFNINTLVSLDLLVKQILILNKILCTIKRT